MVKTKGRNSSEDATIIKWHPAIAIMLIAIMHLFHMVLSFNFYHGDPMTNTIIIYGISRMVCLKIRELLKHLVSKYCSSGFLFTEIISKRDLIKNYEPDSSISPVLSWYLRSPLSWALAEFGFADVLGLILAVDKAKRVSFDL